ncbi:homoserine dehydrogenase [Tengunoibacter tsumagoiensis]|uniref:Homoserine dehydrogenase n=1 Tax=Tengunoibacter tsumagoiensis TaxID=2014871 RepID=A0A402A0B7_9CHLR|nr:homoserine dehydrogenase [Tengunoibacter tsumagoiensis]GCE12597.1 homoserine dehydrogenase [Tengunoibacter tsumagoiensis]
MKQIRLSLLGFGVVGQGFVELLRSKRELLQQKYDLDVLLVSVANGRHGFIYREEGLDPELLLRLAAQRKALTEYPDIRHWARPLDGLEATGGDVLAEATGTNLQDAEPGMSHIRAALSLGMHVISANKGPAALAGLELLELAREQGVQLRLESTVMAGTPVVSTVLEGLAGAQVQALRGILNGTTNYILSAMAAGREYREVLAEAQSQGYAEADPTADVEGYDAVAKTLILAALVFGETLKPSDVARQGITGVTQAQIAQAAAEGKRIKLVASLQRENEQGPLRASVGPMALPASDALAGVDGAMNAITFQTDTLPAVTVIGPGAGRLETGQGLLADLIAIARSQRVES